MIDAVENLPVPDEAEDEGHDDSVAARRAAPRIRVGPGRARAERNGMERQHGTARAVTYQNPPPSNPPEPRTEAVDHSALCLIMSWVILIMALLDIRLRFVVFNETKVSE